MVGIIKAQQKKKHCNLRDNLSPFKVIIRNYIVNHIINGCVQSIQNIEQRQAFWLLGAHIIVMLYTYT